MMERVSVSEAAKRLHVSASTVRRRLRSGELKSEREAGVNGRVWVLLGGAVEDSAPAEAVASMSVPVPLNAPIARVEAAAPALTAWPAPAPRTPISLDAARAARRDAAAGPLMGFAWGARDRRTYRWLASGSEMHPAFGDLSQAARYSDRDQALAAIRLARVVAEPVQVFVAVEAARSVA